MPNSRLYFGNTGGGSAITFDEDIVTFIAAQAVYTLSSIPLANSSHFTLENGSPLTEGIGKDYTIAGDQLTLNLASGLCLTLIAGDTIVGKWATT